MELHVKLKGGQAPQWTRTIEPSAPLNCTKIVQATTSPEFKEEFVLMDPMWEDAQHCWLGCGPVTFEVKSQLKKEKATPIGRCVLAPENLAPNGRTQLTLPLELEGAKGKPDSKASLTIRVEWTPKAEDEYD